jgi:hypothetical protein
MEKRNSGFSAYLPAVAIAIALALGIFAAQRTARPVEAAAINLQTHAPQPPVLVELFTSEGCSSCPPADALLSQLDAAQAVPGTQPVIVLSEHVSYWNDGGWHDPFSSQAFTDRQRQYASHLGLDDVYTPQAVVDGTEGLVGSDRVKLIKAIQAASARPKIAITLQNARWSENAVTAEVSTDGVEKTTLFAALADDSDRSSVLHGENGGRELRHVAVVRTLVELRKTAGPLKGFSIRVKLPAGVEPQPRMRLVVFLADNRNGHILGSAMQTIQR